MVIDHYYVECFHWEEKSRRCMDFLRDIVKLLGSFPDEAHGQ